MVLTNPSTFDSLYNMIKKDSTHGETVLILVARDCDSIAACKILTEILKSDYISFNIKPVAGYDDLIKVNDSLLADNEELKTIIMINCGGNLHIQEIFSNLNDQLVYVIDSHRPYHPSNINDDGHIIIVDDGNYIDELATTVLDEEDDKKKKKKSDWEDGMVDDEMDQDELDNEISDNSDVDENEKKKKKKQNSKIKPMVSQTSTYYGKSVATLMYNLSGVLAKDNLDNLLWYSIIGLTDQLVHERVGLKSYEMEYNDLRQLVLNAYPQDTPSINVKYENGYNASTNTLFSNSALHKNTNGGGVNNDKQIIVPCEDYRFMLYRHWNLYESLYNSKYVACKLKIWKAKGKYLLETLFALMGLPLEQAKQKYISMNTNYKNNIKPQLANHASKFGLTDYHYLSFLKKTECSIDISASDTVYAITALMESDNLESDMTDDEAWEQSFWEAYDSLSNKNVDLLMEGLQQSILLQKEITKQVISMIEKRVVILSGPFRYALLQDSVELKYFHHPMALTKLGLFMMDAFVSMNKPKKPFLIGVLNERKSTYLIVGISGSHSSDIQTNSFGVHFREAVKLTNSIMKYQSFDTSVIEISKLDTPKFIEHLNASLMDEMEEKQEQEEKEKQEVEKKKKKQLKKEQKAKKQKEEEEDEEEQEEDEEEESQIDSEEGQDEEDDEEEGAENLEDTEDQDQKDLEEDDDDDDVDDEDGMIVE